MKLKCLAATIGLLATSGCSQSLATTQKTESEQLKLVSWNIEHLADELNSGCKPRTKEDYAALQSYAKSLDADIVALQEVQSEKALARVFPPQQWQFVLSKRPDNEAYECRGRDGLKSTPQRTAFAIKKSVKFSIAQQFEKLALGNPGLRYGISIKLDDHPTQLEILNVHLKSGCFVDDYRKSDKKACNTFKQQAPKMENWVNTRIDGGQSFVVLGDFNHRLSTNNNEFWQQLSKENNTKVVTNVMDGKSSCHPRYKDLIDHILVSNNASQYISKGSAQVDYFGKQSELTYQDMLSDHCPISVKINYIAN